jgi:hypothetical protein
METLLSWFPLVLHTWPVHGLVMMCPVTVVVAQQRRPEFLPCSAGTWSFTPSHRLSRWGLGRSSRRADLFDKWARERFMGLALGIPFLGTRHIWNVYKEKEIIN